MKSLKPLIAMLLMLAALGLNFTSHAQTSATAVSEVAVDPLNSIQPLLEGEVVLSGTWYRLSDIFNTPGQSLFAAPPFPMRPPQTENDPAFVLDAGMQIFLVDDTQENGLPLNQTQVAAEIVRARILNLVQMVQSAAADRELSLSASSLMSADSLNGEMTTMESEGSSTPMYAESYSSNTLFLEITGVSNALNQVYLTVHGTVADVQYEILSRERLEDTTNGWTSEGLILGLDSQTPTTILIGTRTNNLFFWCRSWQDSGGSGMPDWWQLQYFGTLGIDPYGDDDNDGWTNLQEYQNGTNPKQWNTPAAPQGVTVQFNSSNSVANVSWFAGAGNVTGYSVEKIGDETGQFSLGATTYSLNDTVSSTPAYWEIFGPWMNVSYRVQAHYAGGDSAWSPSVPIQYLAGSSYYEEGSPIIQVVAGPMGAAYLAVGAVPSDWGWVRITRVDRVAHADYGDGSFDAAVDLPLSVFTNGLTLFPAALASAPTDSYGSTDYDWWAQFIRGTNWASEPVELRYNPNWGDSSRNFATRPVLDGRVQLKQNLAFLLRVANASNPFEFWLDGAGGYGTLFSYSSDYVYSSYFDQTFENWFATRYMHEDGLIPFRDNYLFRNFVFSTSDIGPAGNITNGLYLGSTVTLPYPTKYFFQGPATNGANITPLLSATDSQWTYYLPLNHNQTLSNIGITQITGGYSLASNVRNLYGLPYQTVKVAYTNSGARQIVTLNAGQSISVPSPSPYFYPETAQPDLQTVDYYFTKIPLTFPSSSGISPAPGELEFSVTNTSPLLIAGFGQSDFKAAGWAKQQINNGYTGKYAYLGQYFDKTYMLGTNGIATTNEAGVLSAYGNFFPTVPGPAALVTLPDVDTGARGTSIVHVVKLQLDVNHDGVMDLSFGGPDNTSQAKPFTFWVNNDCDWSSQPGAPAFDPGSDKNIVPYAPQYDYLTFNPRSIRDMEDWARLWICGVPALTNGMYQVTLSWGAISSGQPAINLIKSVEIDGGIRYLTDTNITTITNTAWRQIASGDGGYKYKVPTGGTLTLPSNWFTNAGNKYLLFEGAGIGSGELELTISETTPQQTNILARTSTWLDIHDVKDFYERAVITNNSSGAISNWTSSVQTAQYVKESSLGEDQDIIVLVHGINVNNPDWLIESDTVFKRLYHSGYHGKFATVKWPCEYFKLWTALSFDTQVFNRSEMKAYKAGSALKSYLDALRSRFPEHRIHLLAHSQGNAVVGEAIAQGATYDTYVLTEGAIPGSAYDVSTSFHAGLSNAEAMYGPTPEWRQMGYRGIYTNMTGRIVNFYNPKDPVLDVWISDQGAAKPNVPSVNYHYNGTIGIYDPPFGSSYTVTDPQESRAYVSRSRTLPVGQCGPESAHGVIQSAVNLNTRYGFNDSFPDAHSAQWAWPIQTTRPYFQELLRKCQLEPAP